MWSNIQIVVLPRVFDIPEIVRNVDVQQTGWDRTGFFLSGIPLQA
jgi:hypothetical protein